ncbi:hypothetical protein NHX12_023187 [Muraenolepis orangiensis]|uniref:Uncharacterized protein n=1 Tax=Muraenolepis orangiensis TaxID=630683 RepID=A0A9Q0EMN9_9TELE|nr:hypothetical protein NHX12_023187 [Muraenolepis orangiensis]
MNEVDVRLRATPWDHAFIPLREQDLLMLHHAAALHSSPASTLITCLNTHHLPQHSSPASTLITCLNTHHLPQHSSPASTLITCLNTHHLPQHSSPASTLITCLNTRCSSRVPFWFREATSRIPSESSHSSLLPTGLYATTKPGGFRTRL